MTHPQSHSSHRQLNCGKSDNFKSFMLTLCIDGIFFYNTKRKIDEKELKIINKNIIDQTIYYFKKT
jgi:hypothetical protein